MLEKIEKY